MTSAPASTLIDTASHSHSPSLEHTNRAPTRGNRPWRTSSHRNAEHDAATATHAAQRRQSRLDFQTELGSPAERRERSESLNQRMMEGRGDAMGHSSEPRLDTSGSCSSPLSLDVLPVSPLPASALPVSPFDVLHMPVPDGGERPDGDGTSRSEVARGGGRAEGEPLPGGKPLFGQRRGRGRLWRSARELREDDPGDDVALSFADDASPAGAPLKARSPFQWVMKSASGVFASRGGDDGSSSSGSRDSGGSTRRLGRKEGSARAALEEYMNVPMQLKPGRSGDSEPPNAEQMGARRWWLGGPCVVAFKAALAAARRVRIPIVHPYSPFWRDVNIIVGACIAYNLWELLYMVAFDLRATGAWLIVDSCLSLVYLADVLLGFKTGWCVEGGEGLESEWGRGEERICGREEIHVAPPLSALFLHLLPSATPMFSPSSLALLSPYLRPSPCTSLRPSARASAHPCAGPPHSAHGPIGAGRYLTREKHVMGEGGVKMLLPQQIVMDQALRLLKLLRLRRLGQATQQLRQSALAGLYMEMTILVLQICMVCHVGACAFALIGRLESPPESWLAAFNWSNGGSQETLESAPHGVVYAAAYYWAMVTFASVGYGDIHPVDTLAERLFATGYILVTSILLGYTIGQISSLIYSSRARRESVRQRCNTLHSPTPPTLCPARHTFTLFPRFPLRVRTVADALLSPSPSPSACAELMAGRPEGGPLCALVAAPCAPQRRAMQRSLAVAEAVPAVAGAVGYEKESVGEGYVAGTQGLRAALEMRRGEEEWSSQRVSVICMDASFQAKTECEVYLLLLDDLFDALESFPELLTAMRTALGLPLAPDEYLARPRFMASHRSFKGLHHSKSNSRPMPFTADSSSNKTVSFGKGRVLRVGTSSMLQSFKG
ncbi:unnamed protein product [Closterium sp. Yama58-4]|nr:unnamed protein product [Closterium sp. Yama58-4]